MQVMGGAERRPYKVVEPKTESGELVKPSEFGYIFDGHGAQFKGMGRGIYESHEVARKVIDTASGLVPNLKTLCFEDPDDLLSQTRFAQPAIVAVNEAYLRVLMEENPDNLQRHPSYVIGQSLGFLNALHVAGAFGDYNSPESFEKLMRLAVFRGQLMQRKCEELGESGLLVVDSKQRGEDQIGIISGLKNQLDVDGGSNGIYMAIDTNQNKFVAGGKSNDLRLFSERLEREYGKGIRSMISRTSNGAFHTPLMKGIEQELRDYLENMGIFECTVPVLTNTKDPAELITSPEDIIDEMVRLVTEPVRGIAMAKFFDEMGIHAYNLGERKITSDVFYDEVDDNSFLEKIPSKRALAIGAAAITAAGVIAYLIKRNRKNN